MGTFADIQAKNDDDLARDLAQLKREQLNLRFQAATGQLEKPSRVKEVRRTIAQIKTEQTARAHAAAADSAGN
ncbi:MAG: 50S ribosomal protein L29 [Thermaurantiacus sp.]